jgi:hypothetical protein
MDKKLGQTAYCAYWGVRHWEKWDELTADRQQHWENAAAAVAAEVRKQLGWRPIAEAPDDKCLFVGAWDEDGDWCRDWPRSKDGASDEGYTHYLPQPDPPPKEPKA